MKQQIKFKVQHPEYYDLPQLYKMLWKSFKPHLTNPSPDFFKPFVEQNPSYQNENFFIIKDNQKIIAAVQVFLKNVYFKNKKFLMGGIGQVGTLPEYRGKGLASTILKETIKYMKEKKVDYSLLFAGPVYLYKKHGWEELPINSISANVVKKKFFSVADNLYSIKKYSPCYNYELYYIHDTFIKNFNNCIIRNPLYWNSYLWKFKIKNSKTYLLQNNSKKIIAYIIIEKNKNNITINEYCSLDPYNKNHFKILLNYIIKKFKPKNFIIPYSNNKYIPSIVLKEEFDGKPETIRGFMVKNINKKINWLKEKDKVLFFIGDSF